EFLLTAEGIHLVDVYVGAEGVLTGSARVAQEARETAAAVQKQQEVDAKQREMDRKREALEARIDSMRKEFEAEAAEAARVLHQERSRATEIVEDRARMGA